MSAADRRSRIAELLKTVGLDDWGKTPVNKYSKGMQQRLGVAQALLHDPDLIILDEPTDGVDPLGRKELRDVIRGLREQGKTVFINSHLLQEVELVCDRIVIFNGGRMQCDGSIEELTHGATAESEITVQTGESTARLALGNLVITNVSTMGPNQTCLRMPLSDQAALDACVDRLRQSGISILSIMSRRRTLEDAFLDIVSNGDSEGKKTE